MTACLFFSSRGNIVVVPTSTQANPYALALVKNSGGLLAATATTIERSSPVP